MIVLNIILCVLAIILVFGPLLAWLGYIIYWAFIDDVIERIHRNMKEDEDEIR